MVEKNYINKIRDEVGEFARIYQELHADYKAKLEKAYGHKYTDDPGAGVQYQIGDAWTFLFGAPIENLGERQRSGILESEEASPLTDDAEDVKGLFLEASLKTAVLQTVKSLKLHEKRLGGYSTNDLGITKAIDSGKLTLDDLEPLYKIPISEQLKRRDYFISRPKVDGSDPFFWRTLLEIFCRAYVAASGRPAEWSKERKMSLGFDLIDIWQTHFKPPKKWSRKAALKHLREDKKYRKKYLKGSTWKVGLPVVSEVAKIIEPMNKESIVQLAKFDPGLFSVEWDARRRASFNNVDELLKVIEDNRRS